MTELRKFTVEHFEPVALMGMSAPQGVQGAHDALTRFGYLDAASERSVYGVFSSASNYFAGVTARGLLAGRGGVVEELTDIPGGWYAAIAIDGYKRLQHCRLSQEVQERVCELEKMVNEVAAVDSTRPSVEIYGPESLSLLTPLVGATN